MCTDRPQGPGIAVRRALVRIALGTCAASSVAALPALSRAAEPAGEETALAAQWEASLLQDAPLSPAERVETARLVAREEGVLAGISAGANIKAALEIAARPALAGKRVVTVVCDSGERYMSLPFFSP